MSQEFTEKNRLHPKEAILNDFTLNAEPSLTVSTASNLAAMNGQDNIEFHSFPMGQSSFGPPEKVKELTKDLENYLGTDLSKYPPLMGYPVVREEFANNVSETYGIDVKPNMTNITVGLKEGLAEVVDSVVEKGDIGLIADLEWVSYAPMVHKNQGEIQPIPTQDKNGEMNGIIEGASLEKAFENDPEKKIRIIIYSNPKNPSGGVASEEQMEGLHKATFQENEKRAELRQQGKNVKDVMLVLDVIYDKTRFDGPPPKLGEWGKKLFEQDRLIIGDGTAKAYGGAGYRAGGIVASPEITKQMSYTKSNNIGPTPSVAQAVMLASYRAPEKYLDDHRKFLKEHSNAMAKAFSDAHPKLIIKEGKAALYLEIDFKNFADKDLPTQVLLPADKDGARNSTDVELSSGNKKLKTAKDMFEFVTKYARVGGIPMEYFVTGEKKSLAMRLSHPVDIEYVKKGAEKLGDLLGQVISKEKKTDGPGTALMNAGNGKTTGITRGGGIK